jgi:ADP-ribose pyrophosphatase
MQERITATQPIYRGRVVNLDVHDVQLPDGASAKRELIQHPGAVAIVPFVNEREIMLIRQFRLGANRVMVELPAGGLEPNEDPHLAAPRELREEIGMRPNQLERIGGWFVAPGYTTEFIHLFVARDLQPDPLQGDVDEFIEQFTVPFDEALAMVLRGEIENSTAVAGLLYTARYLGR